jgi:hypothetical protein
MAYIGKIPTIGNFQVCDAISVVNGQAAYTMQVGGVNVSPESANHMLVSLNGVIQKPTDAYTVSSSTITFASNLVTGDVIDFIQILGNVLDLGVPSDDTVSTAKIVDANVTSAKMFSGFANGITEADMFRLTASLTTNVFPISANLERVDDASFSKIGTGMTESSGTFSFPKTGLYKVEFIARVINSSSDTISGIIHVTINNSTYDAVALCSEGGSSGTIGHSMICSALVNVTDISNVKVRFESSSVASGSNFEGDTDRNQTCFTFIRLGDSQ